MELQLIQDTRECLGSQITIKLAAYDRDRAEEAIDRAFVECDRIEQSYSRFIKGNALADLNTHLGEWQELEEELFELIAFGQRVSESTQGAFDMSVKSVLEGWGYGPGYSLQEGEPGACGSLEIDEKGRVKLSAEIELGGLGKGYALDRMLACVDEFANVCIDAGGDLIAKGKNAQGQAWRIIFEHPTDISKGIGFVDVNGFAVACSSPSRRKWRDRHHIVNPEEASPAKEMLAVYTQAPAGLLADAYSTALFVLGFDEAKALLASGSLPVEAMLVGLHGRAWRSSGFKGELFS